DGHPMGVAAEIVEYLLRTAEWSLGVDDPFDAAQRVQMFGERCRLGEWGQLTEEAQRAGIEDGRQPLQEQPAIEPGEYADRQEESGPACDPASFARQAATRHDAVHMRVMEQVLSPGMQHGDHAGL